LPHQFKGRLAFKLECVTMVKARAFPPAIGRDAGVTTTALLDL
jgi:hypothetical protein